MNSGTIYPVLQRMEQAGWISGRLAKNGHKKQGKGRPSHYFYSLTELGIEKNNEIFNWLPVAQASDAFHAAPSDDIPPSQQLKLKSALETLRLERLRSELAAKKAAADWECEFKVACERLTKARATIEELKELNRNLATLMAEAEREFRDAEARQEAINALMLMKSESRAAQ